MEVPDGDTFFRMEAGHTIDMSKGGFARTAGAPPVELLIDHPRDSASASLVHGPDTPGASQVSVAQLAYNYLPRTISARDLAQSAPGGAKGVLLYIPPVAMGATGTGVVPGTNQRDVPTSGQVVLDFGQAMDTGAPGVVQLYSLEGGTRTLPASSFSWDATGTTLTVPYSGLLPGKTYWIFTSSFQSADGAPVAAVGEEGHRYFETALLPEQPKVTPAEQFLVLGEEAEFQISMGTGAYQASRAEIVRFGYSPLQLAPLSGQVTGGTTLRLYADEAGATAFRVNFYRGNEAQPFHSAAGNLSARDYHFITVAADPDGWGTVTGDATITRGDSHTVTARAADGYYFVNWTDQGQEVSRDPDYTFTVDRDRHLTAHFAPQPHYHVEVSANPSNGGTVTGTATIQVGTMHTVTAKANPSYWFTQWTENGTAVSADPGYTFTVTQDRTLVANFVFVPSAPPRSPGRSGSPGSSVADSAVAPAVSGYIIDPPEMRRLIAVAEQNGWDFARASSRLPTTVKAEAWQLLGQRRFVARTVEEGAVQVQLTFLQPSSLRTDMQVSGAVKGAVVGSRKSFFGKWFQNRLEIIHLDHTGLFGQRVDIAAKVDLSGMDTGNLHIYRYNRQTNSYILTCKPHQQQYRIDSNGYLHFTTEQGGDFVVSDGPLARR